MCIWPISDFDYGNIGLILVVIIYQEQVSSETTRIVLCLKAKRRIMSWGKALLLSLITEKKGYTYFYHSSHGHSDVKYLSHVSFSQQRMLNDNQTLPFIWPTETLKGGPSPFVKQFLMTSQWTLTYV